MNIPRRVRMFVVIAVGLWPRSASTQTPARSPEPSRIVIPFLANETTPGALEFEGAECDLDASGNRMSCTFQQLFLTTAPVAPDTCLATTSRYGRVFRRDSPNRWTSTEGPEGVCGLLDIATLQDDGGVRWTMVLHTEVTKKDAAPACQTAGSQPLTFSWQNIRKSLPCRFVQPGGLIP